MQRIQKLPNFIFKFSKLFSAFSHAKEIGNLLGIWFGVSIFSPFLCCCLLNSRIIFYILFYILFFSTPSFEDNSLISSKRFSKLLLIFSAASFLLRLSKLNKLSNISLGFWYSKYFSNNFFVYVLFLVFSLLFNTSMSDFCSALSDSF